MRVWSKEENDNDGNGLIDAVNKIYFDSDGLIERVEYDSDNNGAIDSVEYYTWIKFSEDQDSDGAFDISDNCPSLSNPDQNDANSDGIGDACDTVSDTDDDGLTDAEEYVLGTNPSLTDTDTDNYSDFQEQQCGSDPLDPNLFCINYSPVAVDDSVTVSADSTILLSNLLGNDYDPNGDPLQIISVDTFSTIGNISLSWVTSMELSSLDGSNGFVLNGIDVYGFSGSSVSGAGDINGDGFDDLIIGAYNASPNGLANVGGSYVVFGKASGFDSSFDRTSLDGSNGFVLNGIDAYDHSGISVSGAGDINDDGYADLIIGANSANPNGQTDAGESYVVFGKASGFAASLDLADLNGSNGFVLQGIDDGDFSGRSVSGAGDINGDGFDDLIIGASDASPNDQAYAGESYVVFGKTSGFSSSLDLAGLNGSNGFVLNGAANELAGYSVSGAGDVNGDGYADLIIGAYGARKSYVVFGKATGFAASLDLVNLDGSNGFALNGGNWAGYSVGGAGDVDGDGYADLIIGAWRADQNDQYGAGESYVVFGKASGFESTFDLNSLAGIRGFVLNGIDRNDSSGYSVSGAGDINGDGYADLIIGAYSASPNGQDYAGETYVVFGKASGYVALEIDYDPNGQFDYLGPGEIVTDSFTYTISDGNTTDTATVTITVESSIAATRVLSLAGDLDFENVPIGQSLTRTLTLTNSGNVALTVSEITTPAGFSCDWSGTIATYGSRDVSIVFTPTDQVAYNGTIAVISDMTDGTNAIDCFGAGVLDSDGDGLFDDEEVLCGSDPLDPDSICSKGMPWLMLLLDDE